MKREVKIKAFSILELAVVLSLMGLFVSLFFLSVNSFNKTLQQEITIKNELNTFFQFRSTFWLDLEKADSFHLDKDKLSCFHSNDLITYQILNEKLSRKHGDHQTLFEVGAQSISKKVIPNKDLVEFKLDWKNKEFSLFYPLQKHNNNEINSYFKQRLWKR
jgi:hypothetical protein